MPGLVDDLQGATVILYAAPMMEVEFDDGNILDRNFQLKIIREMSEWYTYLDGAKQVILVQEPRSRAHEAGGGRYWLDEERHRAWNRVLSVVAAVHPVGTCLVDYEAYHATQPENRPDGSHMEGQGAVDAARWIINQCPAGE